MRRYRVQLPRACRAAPPGIPLQPSVPSRPSVRACDKNLPVSSMQTPDVRLSQRPACTPAQLRRNLSGFLRCVPAECERAPCPLFPSRAAETAPCPCLRQPLPAQKSRTRRDRPAHHHHVDRDSLPAQTPIAPALPGYTPTETWNCRPSLQWLCPATNAPLHSG